MRCIRTRDRDSFFPSAAPHSKQRRVKFFHTGVREVARKMRRLWLRASTSVHARKLRKAEFDLGWLGWQQAHFTGPEIEAEIAKIEEFERQQAKLLNVSAELAHYIQQLQTQRAAARRQRHETLARLKAERQPLENSCTRTSAAVNAKCEALARFRAAMAKLESCDAELAGRYSELLTTYPQTPESRAALMHLGEERTALSTERQNLQRSRASAESELATLEETLAEVQSQINALDAASQEARKKSAAADRARSPQLREAQRAKTQSAKQMTFLDRNMREPFVRVGQVLADSDVAPLNQPEALEKVRRLRTRLEAMNAAIAQSVAESDAASRNDLWKFYAFLVVAVGAGIGATVILAIR
jgi:chromosome segregation ATPase